MTADYQLTASDIVVRTADGAFIPNDPANADRQIYDVWIADGNVPDPFVPPASPPATITSQDLMAQFTPADIAAITGAISASAQLALLWYSLLAQRDPMVVTNERFQTGWGALTQVLGADRMNEIATALNVTV